MQMQETLYILQFNEYISTRIFSRICCKNILRTITLKNLPQHNQHIIILSLVIRDEKNLPVPFSRNICSTERIIETRSNKGLPSVKKINPTCNKKVIKETPKNLETSALLKNNPNFVRAMPAQPSEPSVLTAFGRID